MLHHSQAKCCRSMASSRMVVRCSSDIHPGKVVNTAFPAFAGELDVDREELLFSADFARKPSYRAYSNSFWKKMECYFTSVTSQEESYLKHQLDLADMATTEAPSLLQILLSAMIETDESKEMSFQSEEKNDFLCAVDDSHSVDQMSENDIGSVDDKIRVELQLLDLCPEMHAEEENAINKDIIELEGELVQQAQRKKRYIRKIYDSIQQGKHAEKRKLEQATVDNKLIEMACKKQRVSRIIHSSETVHRRVSQQIALPFTEHTLAKRREFEESGRSCFDEDALESSADARESIPKPDVEASNLLASEAEPGRISGEPTNAASDSPRMQDEDWQGLDIPMDDLWDVHFSSWF